MRENANGQVWSVVVKVPRIALRRELNPLCLCSGEDGMTRTRADAMQCSPVIVTDSRCFIFPLVDNGGERAAATMREARINSSHSWISVPVRHMQGQLQRGGTAWQMGVRVSLCVSTEGYLTMAVSAWSNRNDMLTSAVPIVCGLRYRRRQVSLLCKTAGSSTLHRVEITRRIKKEVEKKQSNVSLGDGSSGPMCQMKLPSPASCGPAQRTGLAAANTRGIVDACMYVRLYPQALGLACQGRRCCRQPSQPWEEGHSSRAWLQLRHVHEGIVNVIGDRIFLPSRWAAINIAMVVHAGATSDRRKHSGKPSQATSGPARIWLCLCLSACLACLPARPHSSVRPALSPWSRRRLAAWSRD